MDRRFWLGFLVFILGVVVVAPLFNPEDDDDRARASGSRPSASENLSESVKGEGGKRYSLEAEERLVERETLARGSTVGVSGGARRGVEIYQLEGTAWPIRSERVELDRAGEVVVEHLMVANRLLVTLAQSASRGSLESLLERQGAWIESEFRADGSGWVVSFSDYQSLDRLEELSRALAAEAGVVESVEPDFIFRASAIPNEAVFPVQYAMHTPDDRSSFLRADVNAVDGWELRTSAAKQVIAVIDSGVRLSHPDLQANLWVNEAEKADGSDSDDNGYVDDLLGLNLILPGESPEDTSGHGTAVAGLIGAVGNNGMGIAGVVWETTIMPIRFLDENDLGTASDAVKAIDYAVAHGATIINASWGGASKSLVLEQAIERATAADVLFVAAAGNEGWNIDENPVYPACFENEGILTVGAVSNQGDLSRFSNYGVESVDIVAPGENVKSLSHEEYDRIGTFTGTSFAAPLVSGIAALAREHFRETDPVELKNRILLGVRLKESGYSQLNEVLAGGYADLGRVLSEKTNVPANDDFENAIDLSVGNPSYSGSASYATLESLEPGVEEGAGSVWFRLANVPPGDLTISVKGVGRNHATALYRGGSVSELVEVGEWSEATTAGIRWQGSVDLGVSYYLRVASEGLNWYQVNLQVKPRNDAFEDAILVGEFPFSFVSNNRYGSSEDYEPRPAAGAGYDSVWWKLEVDESVSVFLDTEGSVVDTILSVYEGESLRDLELVARNDDLGSGSVTSGITLDLTAGEVYFVQVLSKFGGGGVVLNGAVLAAPRITSQPKDVTVSLGSRTSLRVVVVGAEPIEFQWYKDGKVLERETARALTIESVSQESLGDYHVTVSTPFGSVTSESASVNLLGAIPTLVEQPKSWDYLSGQTIRLSVVPQRSEGVSFQWYRGEEPISGATSRVYEIPDASGDDSGEYFVEVSNANGVSKSAVAKVFVANSEYEFVARTSFGETYFDLIGWGESGSEVLWYAKAGGDLVESSDGVTWNALELLIDGEEPFYEPERILYGNGRFLVDSPHYLASGPSLQALTECVAKPSPFSLVMFHDGYFYGNSAGSSYRSPDGISWEKLDGSVPALGTLVGAGSRWGYFSDRTLIYTIDSVNWIQVQLSSDIRNVEGYAYKDGAFLLMDRYGALYRTVDGTSMEKVGAVPITGAESVYSFGIVGERYVVATSRRLYYSSNLSDWESRENGNSYFDKLIVVGDEMMADGPSLSPHRLFHKGEPDASKPVVTPLDWNPHIRVGVGEPATFAAIVSAGSDPVASVQFRVDGEVVESLAGEGEFHFDWTSQNRGSYVASLEVVTAGGARNSLSSVVDVFERNFKTVFDRNSGLGRIQSVATIGGSVYVVNRVGQLFRKNGLDDWRKVYDFDSSYVWDLFSMNGELWVHGNEEVFVSRDGLSWRELIRLGRNDRFIKGKRFVAWMKEGASDEAPATRLFYDSSRFVDLEGELDRFEGIVLGALYGYFFDSAHRLEVLEQGKSLELYDFPENGFPLSVTEDEEAAYFLFEGNRLYRTENFAEWERIDLQGLESVNGGRAVDSLIYEDGLFHTDSGFVSQDLERWYRNWTGGFEGVEPAADGGFYIATSDGLYHMRGQGNSRRLSSLPGSAHEGGFLKTEGGFYLWGGWSREAWYSKSGLEWSQFGDEPEDASWFLDMAYGKGKYIAIGGGQIVSENGEDWASLKLWDQPFKQIEFGNGVFVACADNRYYSDEYVYSVDGEKWIQGKLPVSISENSELVFSESQSQFLLTTREDVLYRSQNGVEWERAGDFEGARELRAVGEFFYLKDGVGREFYSRDGVEWLRTDEVAVAYFDGVYYGGDWKLVVSSDGYTWEEYSRLSGIAAEDAIGYKGGLFFSNWETGRTYRFDGTNWEMLATVAAGGILRTVNGKLFALSEKIELYSDGDIAASELTVVSDSDTYQVSDYVEASVLVSNVGDSTLVLDSLPVEGRLLAVGSDWTDREGHLLLPGVIEELRLEVGEESVERVRFEIPNGTLPGDYRLAVLLNPGLAGETTLANNYARSLEEDVSVPEVVLTVSVEGNGHAEVVPDRTVFAKGDRALVRALPDPKNEYVGMVGGPMSATRLVPVDMDSDKSITLRFEPIRYGVEWESVGGGAVVFPDGEKDSYLVGEVLRVRAEPEEGWSFVKWQGAIASSVSELELYVSEPVQLTAVFGQRYEAWRDEVFSEEQLLSEAVVGKLVDADGDGLSNLSEYLSGADPNDRLIERFADCWVEGDSLVACFPVNPHALDYTPVLEVFGDSGEWEPRAGALVVEGGLGELRLEVEIDDGVQLVRMRFEEAVGENDPQ